jgi:hypothetical protein
MGMFAFFPWLDIDHPAKIGPLHLLPCERGKAPGGPGTHEQEVMDTIAGCFRDAPERVVERAVALVLDTTNQLRDLTEKEMADVFLLSELLALDGLASRGFFGHNDYCNKDQFQLIVSSSQTAASARRSTTCSSAETSSRCSCEWRGRRWTTTSSSFR